MNFVHQSYQPAETVAAIATPLGEGGVAIIRISGKNSLQCASKVFSGDVFSYKSHTAHFGYVKDAHGRRVDDALLLVLLGTRSYTGEDTVEIHCHGGSLISRRVLDVVLATGIRAAFPGEFTFKAFINGKLDLVQAEAVQKLIAAKNERALDAAEQQLQGVLSQRIRQFQISLTEIAAILEAWVDFPEEGLEFASVAEICSRLHKVTEKMQSLVDTFHDGRVIEEGISLCLVGSPNVGKSSLMNALLDRDRAIVSPIAGTTRDIVEDHLKINGLNVKLIDTAGIRESEESIEQEGIRRSIEALKKADLILLVLDSGAPITTQEQYLIDMVPIEKSIVVWNKSDLPHDSPPSLSLPYAVEVSAKERRGLQELLKQIDQVIWEHGPPSQEELLLTNVRHKEALCNALQACRSVIAGLKGELSPEFLSADMRHCLKELGRIIGTDVTEDILSAIFSKFCVGK